MPASSADFKASPPEPVPDAVERRRGRRELFLLYLASLMEVVRWRLLADVMLISLTSLTEGIGVAFLFPILQVAGFNLKNQGHVGHYTGEVQHLLVRSGLHPSLWLGTLLLVFILLMALRSLFSRAQSVLTFSTVLEYDLSLSKRLYQAIIHADWLYLVRRRSSDFTHVLTAELTRVSSATYLLIGAISNAILALVYVAIALKLSVGMTALVLIAGTALTLVSRRWMRAAYESGEAVSETMSEVYAAATEHLQNLKAMKTYGAQTGDLKMFFSLQSSAQRQSLRNIRSQAAWTFWFEAGSLTVLGAVIFVALQVLRVPPASILLLLAVFIRLMPRLAAGNSQLQAFLGDLPAFENLMQIYRECLHHSEAAEAKEPVLPLVSELRLEDISFRYEAERPPVLHGLSMTVTAGTITGIVGPSGSGKSTIADMVIGLLSPDGGRILVDGSELTPHRAPAWRQQVGYVAQETLLFHESIRVNLSWSRPGASDEEMRQALSLASAEFVFELPRGMDTVVGDRGVLLSYGERQRISLARALLRKPSLLLLDEATSSLDLESEKRILDAIEKLRGRTTVLMIAHRPSAIQRADTIYVVEDGAVVDAGDWKTLSSRFSNGRGSFFQLQNA